MPKFGEEDVHVRLDLLEICKHVGALLVVDPRHPVKKLALES